MKYIRSNESEEGRLIKRLLDQIYLGDFELKEEQSERSTPGRFFSKGLSYKSNDTVIRLDAHCICLSTPETAYKNRADLYHVSVEKLFGPQDVRTISGYEAKDLAFLIERSIEVGRSFQSEWPKRVQISLPGTPNDPAFEGFIVVSLGHANDIAGLSTVSIGKSDLPFRLARSNENLKCDVYSVHGERIPGAFATLSSYTQVEKDEKTHNVDIVTMSVDVFAEVRINPAAGNTRRVEIVLEESPKFNPSDRPKKRSEAGIHF